MSVEEHEEIPWSMLVDQDRRGRSRTWYAVAAVIVAVVVGFVGVRWVEGNRHGEGLADVPPLESPVATTAAPVPTTAAMLSEADLMAVDPTTMGLAAVTRAEWFVTDYFTVDGSPAPDLANAFADDAVLPEMPQDDGKVSFVEWARASAIRPHAAGAVVTVLFRTLYENSELRYERSSVRAVDVLVLIDDESTAIGDLPIPAAVPTVEGITGWMDATGDAPPDAVPRASEQASYIGDNPLVVESGSSGADWRVVLTIDDPSGLRFPVAVRSDTLR